MKNPVKWLLLKLLRFYQLVISPMSGPSCRFYPSCSSYAVQAVEAHGVVKGVYFAVRRLLRCHPWTNGGVDPIPPVKDRSTVKHNAAVEHGSASRGE